MFEDIKCSNCREHALSNLDEHPIEGYFNYTEKGEDGSIKYLGCFRWSWNFHNVVNVQTQKPIVDWETAKKLYGNDELSVCHEHCGEDSQQKELFLRIRGWKTIEPYATFNELLKYISNPKKFGPGKWNNIHSRAMRATTPERMIYYAQKVRETCENIKYSDCRDHALAYLNEHSIELYFNMIEKDEYGNIKYIGCFRWSWEFHNSVNVRTRKPIVDWETAKKLFEKDELGVCHGDCGSSHTSAKPDELFLRIRGWRSMLNINT
jgi:hypothetical protein